MPADLVTQLGYDLSGPRGVHTAVQRVVSTRGFTAFNTQLLHHADRWALGATGGKTTVTSALAGLPVVFLTTTGARTGLERTTPLIGIPINGSLGVIGSNFGGARHPGWVHNLNAHPHGSVRYRRASVDVTARHAQEDEHARIWDRARAAYVGYAKYQARAAERPIQVFVLDVR